MQTNLIATSEASNSNLKAVLGQARKAELLFVPATHEAQAFIEQVLSQTFGFEATFKPRKQKIRGSDLRNLRQGLGAFLGDLIFHASNEDADGRCCRTHQLPGFTA